VKQSKDITMSFVAKARRIPLSPYKVRPLVDVIRGKNVQYALAWLATYPAKKASPLRKMVASAAANAKHLRNIEASDLFIKEIRVDQGPMHRYYKAGAMGRSNIYRKRFCHMEVVLEQTTEKVV
jgi:large subunit ribosomal protein L22